MSRARNLTFLVASALALAAPRLDARQSPSGPSAPPAKIAAGHVTILPVRCDRLVDPKLPGASVSFAYTLLPVGAPVAVIARVEHAGQTVAVPLAALETSLGSPITHTWDGRSASGTWLDVGDYVLTVRAQRGTAVSTISWPISIARFGVTTMAATSSSPTTNEWPLVYYKKATTYTFFATPPIHEYANLADVGETSELDENDGDPRPAVAVHAGLAEPVLESNGDYEDATYNYPLCYRAGANPQLDVVCGQHATTAGGALEPCGYPIAGEEVRCTLADDVGGAWTPSAATISPGVPVTYLGPALPAKGTRQDRVLTFRWQHRATGAGTWQDVPGSLAIPVRFYTIVDAPAFAVGATGTQYAGPWVEVCEQFYGWQQALAIDPIDAATAMTVVVKGMFGQLPGLPTAIEGVKYDCPGVGGDGGANHYYQQSQQTIQLARLLDGHANGMYVNCSDCASTTSAIAGMLGVRTVKMMRLGSMQLKAIWGIGTPTYTLNLWGGGNHGFSYHHVVTRDDGITVDDDCLCVDEDGNALALPGTPGWNVARIWSNGIDGYMDLLAKANVSKSVEVLPKMK